MIAIKRCVAWPSLLGAILVLVSLIQAVPRYLRRHWSRTIELPTVAFYAASDSLTAGDPLELAIHAPDGAILEIARLDQASPPRALQTIPIGPVSQTDSYDVWTGCDWSTMPVPTSPDWRPGLYLLQLVGPTSTYRQVVCVASPEPAEIAVVVSTNTWAAYNAFGGISNYLDSVTPYPLRALKIACVVLDWTVQFRGHVLPSVPLPRRRPNDRIDIDLQEIAADPVTDFSHLVRAEWALLRFLDSGGYRYNVYSDADLAFSDRPTQSKLILLAAHAEYWSQEMVSRYSAFLDGGGSSVVLSGNNWFREVRFEETGLLLVDQRVSQEVVAPRLGTSYTKEGFGTSDPFAVMNHLHPIFSGLGVAAGTVFGGPDHLGNGASGHETDKINEASGSVEVLAVGTNERGPAHVTWKEFQGGGWVLNFSSVRSAPWVERCPVMAGMVHNAIKLALDE